VLVLAHIVTCGIGIALVVAIGTLVNVGTALAIALVALGTGTFVAAISIGALGAGEALGDAGLALVDVLAAGLFTADEPVADVTLVTGTGDVTGQVGAGGVLGTGSLVLTLVIVRAGDTVTLPAIIAHANETLDLVKAQGIGVTVVCAIETLVDQWRRRGGGGWLLGGGGDDLLDGDFLGRTRVVVRVELAHVHAGE